MDLPTAADVRAWMPPDLPWAKLGWPATAPAPPAADPLQKRVDWSIGYIENTTWRPLASIEAPGVTGDLASIESGPPASGSPAPNLVPLAEEAVMLATIQRMAQTSKSHINATVLQDYIDSFTAGSYSERRRAAQDILKSRGSVENPLVNQWRELSDLLYLLMTPVAYDYWRYRLSGISAPAVSLTPGRFGDDFGGAFPDAAWGDGIELGWPGSWPW
jgi:hypothetical protein